MRKPLLVVELAGPAGAGKSTLTKALKECEGNIQIGEFPYIRDVRNLPFFLWNIILLLPTFAALYLDKSRILLSLRQMIIMAILQGWPQRFKPEDLAIRRVIILDQGPVYMLAELIRFSSPEFPRITSEWWKRVCKSWANVLDLVICLDTPDAILIERVRVREKSHGIKENTDKWAAQFLTRYREAQSLVLNSIADEHGGVRVIQVDTSRASLSETVLKIFALIE